MSAKKDICSISISRPNGAALVRLLHGGRSGSGSRSLSPSAASARRTRRRDVVHQFIHRLLRRPCDPAQQRPLDLVIRRSPHRCGPASRRTRARAGRPAWCVRRSTSAAPPHPYVRRRWRGRNLARRQHVDARIFRPRHQEKGFVEDREIGHVLHDRVRLVRPPCKGSARPACSSPRRASLPRPPAWRTTPDRVRTENHEADEAAAAFDVASSSALSLSLRYTASPL